eukprot:jgi/Tetstr1/448377/TSEL_035659.t1
MGSFRACSALLVALAVLARLPRWALGQAAVLTTLDTDAAPIGAVTSVSVCGLVSVWSAATRRIAVRVAHERALLQAMMDVNAANCAIVGPGCEERLAFPGGRLQMNLTLWELDEEMRSAPSAGVRCSESGGDILVGPSTTPQTAAALVISDLYDLPLVGFSTQSPAFSKPMHANFARTVFTDAEGVEALAHFYNFIGWKQVAVLYKADDRGVNLFESMVFHTRSLNISVEAIAMGSDAPLTDDAVEAAVAQLEAVNHKVVFLGISSPWDVASVLLAANERGMNSSSSYVWTTPEDKSRGYIQIAKFLPAPASEVLLLLLPGIIAPKYNIETQASLLKEHVIASQPTPDALNQHVRNLTTSTGAVPHPVTHTDLLQSEEWLAAPLLYAASAYDAIWLIAEGWARAIRDLEPGTARPSARNFMAQVKAPGRISFRGASGNCSWDAGGERVSDPLTVTFTSLALPTEEPFKTSTTVGGYRRDTGVTLSSELRWGDGPVRWLTTP